MSVHLEKEIQKAKRKILALGSLVEEAVEKSVRAVTEADQILAEQVIQQDSEIDELEVELEEDCLKVLALYQPVAIDLRYIVAILKINNDLERIGDLAVTIAKQARDLAEEYSVDVPLEIDQLMDKVQLMLKRSLDALVDMNAGLAMDVMQADNEVDQVYKELNKTLLQKIKDDTDHLYAYQNMLRMIRSLERIADHSTNIAEDILYMINGVIVRHQNQG